MQAPEFLHSACKRVARRLYGADYRAISPIRGEIFRMGGLGRETVQSVPLLNDEVLAKHVIKESFDLFAAKVAR